jgi:hypothetical protein
MTEAAAGEYLSRAGADGSLLADLLARGRVVLVQHGGTVFIRAAMDRQPVRQRAPRGEHSAG